MSQGRDEVLLMSYNNGLASAMTREEFTDAVNWSISNPWSSGVKDIFGSYSPIVRPQEMMTTPGNFEIYKQSGIKAVSLYWTGADRLKWPLNQLPNTRGLEGLIKEVQDLNYVRFTTVNDYLADHGPAGSVTFSQDTAAGSFDGYNSWSEKRTATDYWTRIVEARRIHSTAEKFIPLLSDTDFDSQVRPLLDKAYMLRMKALSTTNFGMATPYVAPPAPPGHGRYSGPNETAG